jgi:hypothetical protein
LTRTAEYVIFVAPTTLQLNIFTQILGGSKGAALIRGLSSAQLATSTWMSAFVTDNNSRPPSQGRQLASCECPTSSSLTFQLLRKKDDDEASQEIAATIKAATALIRNDGSSDTSLSGELYECSYKLTFRQDDDP